MRKLFLVQVLAYVLFSAIAIAQTQDVQHTDLTEKYVQGEVIVRFNENVSPILTQVNKTVNFGVPQFDAIAKQFNCVATTRLNRTRKNSNTNYTYVIRYTAPVDPKEVVKAFMATGMLKYAEPDYFASTGSTTPNDASFNLQWSLYSASGPDIGMREAWDITQGVSSVTVAVIDCGLKLDHPDFAGRVWANTGEIAGNGVDDDGNGYIDDNTGWNFVSDNNDPTDDNGHGTNVTGIIGANGNNSIGIAGIDWNCKLMVLKSFSSGGTGTMSAIISAINYATDNGANVMNMSFGAGSSSALQDAVDNAYAENITMVAAMGNNNSSVASYPAACNHVIAVGATTTTDTRASFSNYGSHISVVAPGVSIYGPWYLSNTTLAAYSGTSQATPHVAGVASLLLAQNSSRTPDQIKAIIQSTADDQVGPASEDVSGWDQYFGWGRLNAYRALTNCITPSPGTITGANQVCVSATITLADTATGGTWSSSNISVATVSSSGVVAGIAQGTVAISYIRTVSCGSSLAVKQIRVNIPPTAISGSSVLCAGSSATLANTSGGGTWTTTDAAMVSVGSATGIVSGVASGTATISYTTGCGTAVAKVISVNLTPAAITGSANICVGTTGTLNNTTAGGTWSSTNTSVAAVGSASGVVTGLALGTANINYVLSSGCQATLQVSVVSPSAIYVAYVPTTNLLGWYPFNGNASNWQGTGRNGTVNGATLATDRFGAANSAYYFDGNTDNITIDTTFFNIGWANYSISCWINSDAVSNPYNGNHNQSMINTIPHRGLELYYNWGLLGKYGILAGTNPNNSGWDILSLRSSSEPVVAHVWKHIAMVKTGGTNYRFYIDGELDTVHTTSINALTYYTKMMIGNIDPTFGYEGFYGKLDDYGIWNRALSDAEVHQLYVGSPAAAVLCEGGTLTLAHNTLGGSWSSSNTLVATVGTSDGIVAGVSSGTSVISYTVGSCISTIVVTVNASGVAPITGADILCAGTTASFSNATPGGTWSSSNTSIATVGAGTGIVSGISGGVTTITYAMTGGCGAAYKAVTVNATSSIGPITGVATVCAGSTTTLGNTSSGGSWISSNTAIADVGSSTGIVSGVAAGTATITYTISGGCGNTATKVVTVGTTGSITGTLALCVGITSTLSGGVSGGTWGSNNAAVATVGATSGVVTAVGSGTAIITYALGSGCSASAVVTVALPASIGGTSNACVGQTATLVDATAGGSWSSSNTSLATVDAGTGVVMGVAAGSLTISYVVSASCYRTISFTVKANPPAVATPVTVCEGSSINILPPSSNGYSWTSSNASVATIGSSSGVLTGISAGTTTLTYTTITGCFVTTVATVNEAPAAITGATALCSGGSSSLSGGSGSGTWSSSNTSVANIGSATGVVAAGTSGTATITYSEGGCRAYAVVSVSPISAITGAPNMCAGSSVTLSDATAGGTWSSSNTAIATVGTTGIVTGIAAGNAVITYTIASGCTRTVTATVIAAPSAITGTFAICPGMISTLVNSTSGGSWSGGNASIATINSYTGVVSGIGAGTINVSYTLTGCRTTAIATVNPLPAAIAGTTNACVAQTATLTNATAGGAWNSNNTSIATVDASTGVVTGVSAATTLMTYTLGTGCYKTVSFTVKALPPAIASPIAACVGTSTSILPPSTNGKSWSSSNTAVATIGSSNGIMTGVATGTTTLTYTTTTGCFVTTEATVYALPSAGTITGPASVVVGSTITLDNAAGGGVWSSSNTARATVDAATGIVTGVAGGTATISYSVTNPGCTVRATQMISVATSRPGSSGYAVVSDMQLYPNPTTGAFTVEVEEPGVFSIFMMDGRKVITHKINKGINQLTLSNELANGIYMCRFTSGSGNTTMVRLVYER